ncbi:MAG TPA: biotin--[acetyl-CoA-carboxylase] ligase [Chthonomonadaceae bacterium]|nr:biotin--[acetyl-CoA-carboxylase] ligase [Chthonomonadaceae bacterium]
MAWRHFSPSRPESISLRILERVGSTMDVARQEVRRGRVAFDCQGRSHYAGVMAREQTAGRGQRGRAWFAPYNEALCITYFVRHGLADPPHAASLALLVGVAVADTLCAHLTPPSDIGLKWPNDILLNGKKLGGILIEMVRAPDNGWVALVGVGLNLAVRAFPPELAATATSLALEGRPAPSPEAVAAQIAQALPPLAALTQLHGLPALLARWRAYDRTPGRRYTTEQDGHSMEGIAVGIDDTGALLLRLLDGTVLPVTSASSLREH